MPIIHVDGERRATPVRFKSRFQGEASFAAIEVAARLTLPGLLSSFFFGGSQ